MLNDAATMLALCTAGYGIAQMFALGLTPHFKAGSLIHLFPSWSDEPWDLYAFYPHRQHRAAKVGAFLDFVSELTGGSPLRRKR